jgi:hypothetical protein
VTLRRWLAVLVLPALIVVAGCTSASPSTRDTTVVQTVSGTVHTARPPTTPLYTPAPATTVAGLPPGAVPPHGEREATCPYISTQDAAETEGNRIYRTTIITTTRPVGCRFYFWCCDFHATMDIVSRTFGSALEAYNAMVRTGEAGSKAIGVKALVPGVSAMLYQTKFYGPDGATDWACTFAKGSTMVTVHTNQNDVSFNAKQLAALIAPRF